MAGIVDLTGKKILVVEDDEMNYIYLSLVIFTVFMIFTFIVLEKKFKIKSQGKRIVHYTPVKILLRGILTGTVITISVL